MIDLTEIKIFGPKNMERANQPLTGTVNQLDFFAKKISKLKLLQTKVSGMLR
jgi:hypothetical protein